MGADGLMGKMLGMSNVHVAGIVALSRYDFHIVRKILLSSQHDCLYRQLLIAWYSIRGTYTRCVIYAGPA